MGCGIAQVKCKNTGLDRFKRNTVYIPPAFNLPGSKLRKLVNYKSKLSVIVEAETDLEISYSDFKTSRAISY